MNRNYYDILEVDRYASADAIKHSFRRLAQIYHPDKNLGDKIAEEQFKEILEAYNILSDAAKRRSYDEKFTLYGTAATFSAIEHYFTVTCDKSEVLLNEEIRLTYTYSGMGRYFRKPALSNFFITSRPYVNFRNVILGGQPVKETSLTYILSPLSEGKLEIPSATIKIDNKAFTSDQLSINVKPNQCFFSKHTDADGKPYKFRLFFEEEIIGNVYRTSTYRSHIVLIPRSHKAQYFHTVGSVMKYVFTFWGLILSSEINVNPFLGIIGGSLFAGIMAHLMYLLFGVKSKFYFAEQYNTVQEYIQQGYRKGSDRMASKYFDFFYYLEVLMT